MSAPTKTKYSSSSDTAVELAWKLKNLTETHDMSQRRILDAARETSRELTVSMQESQKKLFAKMIAELGVPSAVYGDGSDWALSVSELDQGRVAMVHHSVLDKGDRQKEGDDCNCMVCEMRRMLTGASNEAPDKPTVH